MLKCNQMRMKKWKLVWNRMQWVLDPGIFWGTIEFHKCTTEEFAFKRIWKEEDETTVYACIVPDTGETTAGVLFVDTFLFLIICLYTLETYSRFSSRGDMQ